MILLALAMAAAIEGATPSQAATPAQPVTPATQPAKSTSDADKVICRREEVTGSRFPRRICMTGEAWQAQEAASKQFAQDAQNKASMAVSPGR